MKKLIFYSNSNLKRKVEFEKIGITFRRINSEENELIIDSYKEILINKKNKDLAKRFLDIKNNREKYERKEVEKVYYELISLEEKNKFTYDIIMNLYIDFIKNPFERMNLTYIRKYIKKLVVVEIDCDKFGKQFKESHANYLVSKIMDFSNYIATVNGEINKFDSFLFDYDMFVDKNNKYHLKILALLLNQYSEHNYFESNNIEKLEIMLNKNDTNFNFNFMMIIDGMFNEDSLTENKIVQKVSFLERLLISKEDNKRESFILKVGILCNNLLYVDNIRLSKQLKAIYDIRSLIVHGDTDKIINNISKYKNIFNNLIEKKSNKHETKLNILVAADFILEFYFIEVLKRYLEDYKLCEYIKSN